MSNIVTTIIDYVANIWHNTDQDIVMAEHINGWENELQNISQFLSRYAWHPNTAYPKGSVILYPLDFILNLFHKMQVQAAVKNLLGRTRRGKKVQEL